MSERVNKISVSMSFLAGVILSLITVIAVVFIIMQKPRPELSVIIRSVPWRLPTLETNKDYADQLADVVSMYLIVVKNIGDMEAKNIVVSVPDAKIIEVVRYVREGKTKRILRDSKLILCGDLDPSLQVCVTAWSTSLPITEYAENVRVFSDMGRVRIKVEAQKGIFAHLIDRMLIGVSAACLVTLVITLLLWRKHAKLQEP